MRNATIQFLTALSLGAVSLTWSAPPILKTGACPTLTRYNAPSGENWATYPVEPQPQSSYPTGTIQNPLTPEQSINCIQVPAGLRLEGVASELTPGPTPGLGYLMYFTFDERGRVWAAEPRDYPAISNTNTNFVVDPNPTDRVHGGKGRIVILEDTDGDGSLDSYKVFYDGLVMPTSLEIVNGGVIATCSPIIVYLPKSSGNPDTAGTPVTLFSGMGSTGNTWDTHGGINSLTSGLDNWMYGHTGYNGCGTVSGVTCSNGQVYRFKHTAMGAAATTFQAWTTGPANAHGIGQMEDGQIFQSGATGTPHNNHSLRRAACCGTAQAAINIQTSGTYYPITGDRFMWEGSTNGGPDNFTTTTSASSGHDFYTARLLPQKYWSRFSFVCEGASKLCNQDSMVVSGSTWSALRMTGPVRSNIFASTDAWVAPLKVRTGPDGALWVLDWYNYLFLHNPATPATNAAWNNSLRNKSRTRLYRIVPEDGHVDPVLNLTNATTAQLVDALGNSNFLWRMQAQRLLIAKGYTAELGTLLENVLTNHKSVDVVGIDPQVIHSVWTLEGLNMLATDTTRWNPLLRNLLLHPAWGVRENVLKAMPRTASSAQIIKDACAADDPHAHVRIQAYLALAESPAAPTGAASGSYRATDSYSTAAFDAAGTGKLAASTPASTRPGTCPGISGVTSIGRELSSRSQPKGDLHFSLRDDGFELLANGRLNSGELLVYDLRGKLVFRSVYNAAKSEWSQKTAKGLRMPVYLYKFRGNNGDKYDGRLLIQGAL